MPRFADFPLIAAFLLGSATLSAGEAAAPRPDPWGSLVGHSPFASGLRSGPVTGETGGLEFRGVVGEAGEIWVNLYDPVAKRARWFPVPGSPDQEINAQSYDPETDHLVVVAGGRRFDLLLRQGRVSLPAAIAPLVVSEDLAPPQPGEGERAAFVRQLPPAARDLLEQASRRRQVRGEPYAGPAADFDRPRR
jgi:hypothetical protein